jgi:hypothetical protein
MMKRISLVLFVAVAGASIAGAAEMKQIPVVSLHTETDVAAPPAAVWAFMTSGKNLVTWCPQWKSDKNAARTLSQVGDVLDYTDDWGNNGRSIVTYLVKAKELRVAHEPNDGSYLCQAKLVLTPTEQGTRVHYWEQYTDESEPKDLKATADKVSSEMEATLAALRKGVEKK